MNTQTKFINIRWVLSSLLYSLFVSVFLVTSASAKYEYWETTPSPPRVVSSHSPVQVDIVDDHGRTLNKYEKLVNHNIHKHLKKTNVQRAYLEAIKGKQYNLRIRNTSNKRVGVVIAVDGRNILTGKKSWLRKNEKMYILGPHETSTYKGWRTSKSKVNRFYFTSAGDSYADAWGDQSAMGVIAVAVYNEKPEIHYYENKRHSHPNAARSESRSGYLADESTGTGFGHEEYSPTIRVDFKAENNPVGKYFLKYEWRKTLCDRGIIPCHNNTRPKQNNRFWPSEVDNDGFAPYPPFYSSKRK